jgi:hypothetical protein
MAETCLDSYIGIIEQRKSQLTCNIGRSSKEEGTLTAADGWDCLSIFHAGGGNADNGSA